MTSQSVRKMILTIAAVLFLASGSAMACPNCKLGNETESSRPRAYMYSILFMIGMPATIFTGFGISFYRMVKKANLEAGHADPSAGEFPQNSPVATPPADVE